MSTLTYKLVDAVGDAAKGHKLKVGLSEITFKVLNKSNSKILSGRCTLKLGEKYYFSAEDGPEGCLVGDPPQLCIIINNDFSIRTCVGSMVLDQWEAYYDSYIPENLVIDELGIDLADQTTEGSKLVIKGGIEHEYEFNNKAKTVFAMEPFFYTDVDQF